MKTKTLWPAVMALALLFGCDDQPKDTEHHAQAPHRETVQVRHLTDGRYCYHGDDGFWYWYMASQPSAGTASTYYVSTTPARSASLPSSGSWVRASSSWSASSSSSSAGRTGGGKPPTEEDLEGAHEEQVEIVEAENGQPMPDPGNDGGPVQQVDPGAAQAAGGRTADESEPEAANEAPAEAPAEAAPADSGDAGSSGGDSGGGGE